MGSKNISMSDKDFVAPYEFQLKVCERFGISEQKADHLIFSSWRKFKLILARDRELRENLRLFLDDLDKQREG